MPQRSAQTCLYHNHDDQKRLFLSFSASLFSFCFFTSAFSASLKTLVTVMRFPPIRITVSISSPFLSNASISSPPPMLLPCTSMFGTVFRPVRGPRYACSSFPNGCTSSSTTYGGGRILYLSSKMCFAFFEYGQ